MQEQKIQRSISQDKQQNRNSNSTNSTEDDFNNLSELPQQSSTVFNNCHVQFLLGTNQQKISKKYNKVAVNWIQTQCMVKNIEMEANLLAITLYYCISRVRKIEKCEIQPILIACLTIASKLYNGPIMAVRDGLSLVSTQYPPQKIMTLEQQIISSLNYNLHFSTTFTTFQQLHSQDPTIYNPVCFLLQLFLLKQCSVLFSTDTFDNLTTIASFLSEQINSGQAKGEQEKGERERQGYLQKQKKYERQQKIDKEMLDNLCEMVDKSQAEVLINKYRSMFDVDKFVQKMKNKK